jgi:hypothetical protein
MYTFIALKSQTPLAMNIRLVASALLISFSTAALMYGCKKEDDNGNNAVTSTNGDYAGTWNANETCSSAWSYQMTASATGTYGVQFTNFHKGTFPNGFTINATVSDKNLTIASQAASCTGQGGPYTFAGSGTFTPNNSLTLQYTMVSGTSTLSCTANCSK